MDLAASIQAVTEEAIVRMVRSLVAETGLRKLCLAGGVALNCVANGKVLRDGAIDAFGFSRPPEMPGARSAPRSLPIMNFSISREELATFLTGCRGPISAPALRLRRSRSGCAMPGRSSGLWRTRMR